MIVYTVHLNTGITIHSCKVCNLRKIVQCPTQAGQKCSLKINCQPNNEWIKKKKQRLINFSDFQPGNAEWHFGALNSRWTSM